MKKLFGLVFSLVVMAGAAASANAQEPPPHGPPGGFPPGGGGMRMQMQMPSFADMDKNKDKKLSRDEVPSQFPQQFFDRLDENKDGFIDEPEWDRMQARFRSGGGGMRMEGPRWGESLTKLLDANSDSKVSREEFARMAELFDRLDQDKNGDLSQEELNGFMRAVSDAQHQATGDVDVNRAFQTMDKNKDGKITPDETTEQMFRNLDLNKDGSVPKEEAEQAIKKMAAMSKAKSGQSNQATTPKNP
jgi:Ca2+-binding EF-hand superfamily protein